MGCLSRMGGELGEDTADDQVDQHLVGGFVLFVFILHEESVAQSVEGDLQHIGKGDGLLFDDLRSTLGGFGVPDLFEAVVLPSVEIVHRLLQPFEAVVAGGEHLVLDGHLQGAGLGEEFHTKQQVLSEAGQHQLAVVRHHLRQALPDVVGFGDDRGTEQFLLVAEVVVDGALGLVGLAGDVVHRSLLEPELPEQLRGHLLNHLLGH